MRFVQLPRTYSFVRGLFCQNVTHKRSKTFANDHMQQGLSVSVLSTSTAHIRQAVTATTDTTLTFNIGSINETLPSALPIAVDTTYETC